jgi:hypothetical protein
MLDFRAKCARSVPQIDSGCRTLLVNFQFQHEINDLTLYAYLGITPLLFHREGQ